MKLINQQLTKSGLFALATISLAMSTGVAVAKEETLECTLYMADSMDSETQSSVELKDAGLMLNTIRHSSVCLFRDGRVADKQFVTIARVVGDGSTGSTLGFSVYTMENGDSISAEFTGAWGSEGFKGVYNILGGTGSYGSATGDGTITGVESPWTNTGIVEILLNVQTP